jgi:hypothetical protein
MTRFTPTHLLVVAIFLAAASNSAFAGVEIVEIETVQVVRTISGVVRDPGGAPIPGATVTEVSPDWKTAIQSTTTNADGTFAIGPRDRKKVYHLKISFDKSPDFNPLIVHVRLSRWTGKKLTLKLELTT